MTGDNRSSIGAGTPTPKEGAAAPPTAGGPRNLTKHRLVQTGIWTPAGASTRIMYAANSDAGCSLDGQRKTNQDSFVITVPDPKGSTALFGVFDGHGENGHLVSRCCRARYPEILKAEMKKRPNDLDAAVTAAYVNVDQECNAQTDCSQSGTPCDRPAAARWGGASTKHRSGARGKRWQRALGARGGMGGGGGGHAAHVWEVACRCADVAFLKGGGEGRPPPRLFRLARGRRKHGQTRSAARRAALAPSPFPAPLRRPSLLRALTLSLRAPLQARRQ